MKPDRLKYYIKTPTSVTFTTTITTIVDYKQFSTVRNTIREIYLTV